MTVDLVAGRLDLIRGLIRLVTLYFSTIPSVWVLFNPLLYIMFLPLGINYAMTMPWPFLKDTPDPFGRGTSLYYLTYVYWASMADKTSYLWSTIANTLMLSGMCLFLWSFAFWLRSQGELMVKGSYRMIRHPQYLGLVIAVLGLSLRAARPMALISWGAMSYVYIMMAHFEEQSLTKKLGQPYLDYKTKTWFMLPVPKILTRRSIPSGILSLMPSLILIVYILTVIYISPYHVVSLRSSTF